MPTVASVPLSALAIWRESAAASAGWPGEVQIRGAAAAGAARGVPTGPGVLAGVAVLAGAGVLEGTAALARAGPGVLAGAAVPAGARGSAGAGATAEPEISRAESARAYQGHRPGHRFVIALLWQRTTIGSEAGVTMSSACENRESFAGRGQTRLLRHVVRDRRQVHRCGATIHGEHGPGYRGRVLAGQERYHRRDLAGLGRPSQRHLRR